jgi:hypothetical protein
MPIINTIAYFGPPTVMKKKRFITVTPGKRFGQVLADFLEVGLDKNIVLSPF